jgi:hypothetical protein
LDFVGAVKEFDPLTGYTGKYYVEFAAGQTHASFTIDVRGDNNAEGDEEFTITLVSLEYESGPKPSQLKVLSTASTTVVTISDDD